MRQAEEISFIATLGVVGILLVVILVTYISLLLSGYLMRFLGVTGTNVLTRVFGIILAALAVQNMITGISLVVQQLIKSAV
jgi:multiple antibiotic resistance protein